MHYGKKYDNKHGRVWACTKSKYGPNPTNMQNKRKNHRCTATLHTRIINGYEMVRVANPKHICFEYMEKNAKKSQQLFIPFRRNKETDIIHT